MAVDPLLRHFSVLVNLSGSIALFVKFIKSLFYMKKNINKRKMVNRLQNSIFLFYTNLASCSASSDWFLAS